MKVLVIEDDKKINSFIGQGLKEAGYSVELAYDGLDGLDILQNNSSIDILVLDLMLPKMNGEDVLKKIRSEGSQIPVIILSAKRTVEEKVEGLQFGADDYLVKPFAFSELLARIQVLLRRNHSDKSISTKLSHFGITLDLMTRKVFRDGKELELQTKEFTLLEYFLRNPERVLSKTMILENVYNYNFDPQTNVVDVLVCRLRSKIDKEFNKSLIHTLRGMGYVLKED